MHSDVRDPASQGRDHGDPPEREAEVTVLASAAAGIRPGARVFPLDRSLRGQHSLVGAEVAVTASLIDMLPVSRTVAVAVLPDLAVEPVVAPVLAAVRGILGQPGDSPSTLTIAVAGSDAVTMYNLPVDAVGEAMVEAVAVGRRTGLTTPLGNCVLLLQRFLPATASAVVHASHRPHLPVGVAGRWGLESTGAADTFEVAASGDGVRGTLADKPTATVVTGGGTRTVALPENWRHRASLTRDTVRRLATMSRNAAVAAGRPLALEFAMSGRTPTLLRVRPD